MEKVDALRKIIREELRAALKEELPKLLSEVKVPVLQDPKKNLQEQVKSKIPGTLNTAPAKPTMFTGNNPMANLLNETAMDLMSGNMEFSTDDVSTFGFSSNMEAPAGTIGGMLTSARPSSNIDMVQINEVPDFSALMAKMKNDGQI
jgi:hypothetical protein